MSAVFTPTRYKLSIEDYHKLGEVGILNEDSRVELIEGELIQMAPIGGPHMWAVNNLNRLLISAVGTAAVVSPQNPVILPPNSEPQPDFTVLRQPSAGQRVRVPLPEDVLLVVEVSDTTLAYDRSTKLRLYARSAIPELWIVDVNARQIEIHRDPVDGRYDTRSIAHIGDIISLQTMLDARVSVADVFGKQEQGSTDEST